MDPQSPTQKSNTQPTEPIGWLVEFKNIFKQAK